MQHYFLSYFLVIFLIFVLDNKIIPIFSLPNKGTFIVSLHLHLSLDKRLRNGFPIHGMKIVCLASKHAI